MNQQQSNIIVKFAADRMKAYTAVVAKVGAMTREELVRELFHKGVVHGLDAKMLKLLTTAPPYGKLVEIAKGTPSEIGKPGRIDILVPDLGPDTRGQPFPVVSAGSVLARRVPPTDGEDGINIFGAPVPPPPAEDAVLKAGRGTRVSDGDPNILVAKISGAATMTEDGAIEVHPYLEVAGDVNIAETPTAYLGYMRVCGNVLSGAAIETAGSLEINGTIENGVKINCGGDLMLRSPVKAAGLEIECAGNIYAVSLEDANVKCAGDIFVEAHITKSNVACRGAVRAKKILGGAVRAVCGIAAEEAGGTCGSRTQLDIGFIQTVAQEYDELVKVNADKDTQIASLSDALYWHVRGTMDEEGAVPEAALEKYEKTKHELSVAISARKKCLTALENVEKLLLRSERCVIVAALVHPNVLMTLGASEQDVRDTLTDVQLRPTGMRKRPVKDDGPAKKES